MPQVSLRIQKLKCSNISGAKKHNQRTHQPDNADPDKKDLNQVLVGSDDLDSLVFSRIKESGAKYIESGKNASTLAVEMVLSASPEYFRDNPSDTGEFDEQKMVAWRDANLSFLKKKYGDNLVRVDLHLDEATPHMHAIITPLVEKQRKLRGKDAYRTVTVLDAKNMFNRSALVELQTDAAEAVKHLGIQRGLRYSKAKHTSIKQFYSQVEIPTNQPLERFVRSDEISTFGGYSKETLKNYANYCIERYEKRLSEQNARIQALETQLKTKQDQLAFYAKYQEDKVNGRSLVEKVRDDVFLIKKRFDESVERLSKKHDALLSRNHDLEMMNQELTRENMRLKGWELSEEDLISPQPDVLEVSPEMKPIDKEKEIRQSREVAKSYFDLDFFS